VPIAVTLPSVPIAVTPPSVPVAVTRLPAFLARIDRCGVVVMSKESGFHFQTIYPDLPSDSIDRRDIQSITFVLNVGYTRITPECPDLEDPYTLCYTNVEIYLDDYHIRTVSIERCHDNSCTCSLKNTNDISFNMRDLQELAGTWGCDCTYIEPTDTPHIRGSSTRSALTLSCRPALPYQVGVGHNSSVNPA
jgi:hypothetical protein